MHRLPLIAALLVACSPPSGPERPANTVDSVELLAREAATTVAATAKPEPRRLWAGRHSERIVDVELSEDGAAAVTVDAADHARLWPALDGSREPLVLPIAAPADIAVLHDGNGFAVAVIDIVGGLDILTVDNAGRLTARANLDSDPGYTRVVATSRGFVTARADHHVEWIDRRGIRQGSLAPLYGDRVANLLSAADRVLVLFEGNAWARSQSVPGAAWIGGRWLELGERGPAWSQDLKLDKCIPKWTFISADGKHLATMRANPKSGYIEPAVVDLASGAMTTLEDPVSLDTPPGRPLGFQGAQTVVFKEEEGRGIAWYGIDGRLVSGLDAAFDFQFNAAATVAAGNTVLSIAGRTPVTVTPHELRFLGYRRETAGKLRETAVGAIADLGTPSLLDPSLRSARRIPSDSVPITRDLALVRIGVGASDDDASARQPRHARRVALYDLAAKRELQTWPIAFGTRVRYEPATHLMVIDRQTSLEVARFDPTAGRFAASTSIALPISTTNIELLDPALSGGDVALTLHGREVRRWSMASFETRAVPEPTPIAKRPLAIDRAGRLYMRDGNAIVVNERGAERRIDGLAAWSIRPSPNATRIAAFGHDRIELVDLRGRELWSVALPGVADLAWTTDDKLVASTGDLIRLSARDGAIEYAQCGWSFAARTDPDDVGETAFVENEPDRMPLAPTFCDR